jgi:hypothetical protein
MEIDVLHERPFLTGLLLGLVVWLFGATAPVAWELAALLFFGVGVVLAVFADRWIDRAGQALAAAGATALLFDILWDVLEGLLVAVR